MKEIIIQSLIYIIILIGYIMNFLTIRLKNKRIELLEEQIKKQKELINLFENFKK